MGLLITIEGGEYVGKSSVVAPYIKLLCDALGIDSLISREPGGTPEGEVIRQQIFQQLKEGATAMELALLFNKARQIHLKDIVIPFLGDKKEKKRVVILDRYLDSTRIYQGIIGGVSEKEIHKLEDTYVNGFLPDITLILYFPEKVFKKTFLDRQKSTEKNTQREKNDWDDEDISKHLERQRLYLTLPLLAKNWKENRVFIEINAAQTPDKVKGDIKQKLLPVLERQLGSHFVK